MKSHDWKVYQMTCTELWIFRNTKAEKWGWDEKLLESNVTLIFKKWLQPQPGSARCWGGKGDFISWTTTVPDPVPHGLLESCHSLAGMLSAEPPDPGQNVRIDGFKKENVAEVTPRDFQITPSRAVRKRGSPSSPLRRAQVGRLRRGFKDDPVTARMNPSHVSNGSPD